ncbi:hypothetical protein GALMADRAFT_273675 [Galerina marginata CBS 339.88]|uniref:DUF6699 domain-containing protein n=1 Tax=Galerina marginata (strain CBS 339.88) TaxID=685588 RepID=A0A067S8P7_GALM3|nr:hypothetical protein GALMADRAFT_273675 [Galerina marginata CBS 339.88]
MPGIINNDDAYFTPDEQAYSPRVSKGNHNNPLTRIDTTTTTTPHHHAHVHAHRTSHGSGESHRVPYPFRTQTTAYGLNEPQWSVGPPPLIYELSPYARVPLPPLFKIHPILAFSPSPAQDCALDWLVDKHPERAEPTAVGRQFMGGYHWTTVPATDPARGGGVLHIRLEPFRQLVTVHPGRSGVITVGDVLRAVYVGARQNATELMMERLGVDRSSMERQMSAYARLATHAMGPVMGDDEAIERSRTCGCSIRVRSAERQKPPSSIIPIPILLHETHSRRRYLSIVIGTVRSIRDHRDRACVIGL